MSITGESFDYGPYRFLPRYDPDFVAAYFDHRGSTPTAASRAPCSGTSSASPRPSVRSRPTSPLAAALADFEPALDAEITRRVVARLGLAPGRRRGRCPRSWRRLRVSRGEPRRLRPLLLRLVRRPLARAPRARRRAGEHYAGARWDALRAYPRALRARTERADRLTSRGTRRAPSSSTRSRRSGAPSPRATTGARSTEEDPRRSARWARLLSAHRGRRCRAALRPGAALEHRGDVSRPWPLGRLDLHEASPASSKVDRSTMAMGPARLLRASAPPRCSPIHQLSEPTTASPATGCVAFVGESRIESHGPRDALALRRSARADRRTS